MKESFIDHRFSESNLSMIVTINGILDEYEKQGFRLSLRQLFYQFVARDFFPEYRRYKWTGSKWIRDLDGTKNATPNYKWLGTIVTDARQAGLVDWAMIEDRNRETIAPPHWKDPAEIVNAAASQFRIDKWEKQEFHIEIMVEKDALSGVLDPVCRQLDINITANKGYCSSSTMYEIGKRLGNKYDNGKKICVIYLGDHDPSGIDMTRDVDERLQMFSRLCDIEVVRVALNWDQVELWHPPENPAKETDSRFAAYVERYGESSWELDAVEPTALAGLVSDAVLERRDDELWDKAIAEENDMRQVLRGFVDQYN